MMSNFARSAALASLLVLGSFFGTASAVEVSPELQKQARDFNHSISGSLLEDNDFEGACRTLKALPFPNTQTLFMLGLCNKGLGEFSEAVTFFEKVVADNPEQLRPKLELAQTLVQAGQFDRAVTILEALDLDALPSGVRENVEGLLNTARTQDDASNWEFTVLAGITLDSNANAAPASDTINFPGFGLNLLLSDDAKETRDISSRLNLNAAYTHTLDPATRVIGAVNVGWTNQARLDSLDTLVVSASSTFQHQVSQQMFLSVPVFASQTHYDNSRWRNRNLGISPLVAYSIDEDLSANAGFVLNGTWYTEQLDDRNGYNWLVPVGMNYAVDENITVSPSLSYGQQHSGVVTFSNKKFSGSLTGAYSFENDSIASLSASYGRTNYRGIETGFLRARSDDTYGAAARYIYTVEEYDLSLISGLSYTDNRSTIDLYDYDRVRLDFSIRKTF